jgi:hypothetical protein
MPMSGIVRVALEGSYREFGAANDRIRRRLNDCLRQFGNLVAADAKANWNDRQVLALDEADEPQLIKEGYDRRHFPLAGDQYTKAVGVRRPLRAYCERPHGRRSGSTKLRVRGKVGSARMFLCRLPESVPGPGCVKTPTSNFRVERLFRLR